MSQSLIFPNQHATYQQEVGVSAPVVRNKEMLPKHVLEGEALNLRVISHFQHSAMITSFGF